MKPEDIRSFVEAAGDDLPAVHPYGVRYRVSATLNDGVHLPCVVVESRQETVDLAIRRFEETRDDANPHGGYRAIVSTFVTGGNGVHDYDIRELQPSSYAIPIARMREIGGETRMSWTAFCGVMSDGKRFRFGTTFLTEFFNMPDGYCASDIVKIIPGESDEGVSDEHIYRERPFFTCYID